ncbi:MAG TPA: hypothetical protein VFK02_08370 [Kofleriaceae bacterium]|nr:hypothetical protein [Kofleriaceae bacterium]
MTLELGRTTTRDERLAWRPDEAIAAARRPGPDERATVALAMFDQLDSAGLPLDALELSIVYWSRALDGLAPGPVPADRLAQLDRELAIEAQTAPPLARWLAALRRDVATAHDLDWAIQFLLSVRQTWTLTTAARARGHS